MSRGRVSRALWGKPARAMGKRCFPVTSSGSDPPRGLREAPSTGHLPVPPPPAGPAPPTPRLPAWLGRFVEGARDERVGSRLPCAAGLRPPGPRRFGSLLSLFGQLAVSQTWAQRLLCRVTKPQPAGGRGAFSPGTSFSQLSLLQHFGSEQLAVIA